MPYLWQSHAVDIIAVIILYIMSYALSYLLCRLLESVHGGNNRRYEGITPLDQQDQLFTKAIDFPVKESHAWTEKVISFTCLFIYLCLEQPVALYCIYTFPIGFR